MGAGAATIALAGAAVGIGFQFFDSIHSVARNPSLAKQLFGYVRICSNRSNRPLCPGILEPIHLELEIEAFFSRRPSSLQRGPLAPFMGLSGGLGHWIRSKGRHYRGTGGARMMMPSGSDSGEESASFPKPEWLRALDLPENQIAPPKNIDIRTIEVSFLYWQEAYAFRQPISRIYRPISFR